MPAPVSAGVARSRLLAQRRPEHRKILACFSEIATIRVIALGALFRIYSVRNTRRGLSAMTKIAIPPDLAGMFAACEDAYEQATQEGHTENSTVVAAVTVLKSA
jgi:hypothetical protein